MDIEQQLSEISAKLDKLLAGPAVAVASAAAGSATTVIPAYELPALPVSQITADDNFVNRDGSVWVMSTTNFSPGTPSAAVPVLKYYGYISQAKCPELFEQAKRSLDPDGFAAFLAEVQAHPYGVWSSNPGIDATLNGNNVMFSFRVHRVKDFVQ